MNALANQLVRPYRFFYNIIDLGKRKTAEYQRHDAVTLNNLGQKLFYSYYKNAKESDVCVVYAHCNSGCRIEGLQYVKSFIEKGWNVLLFDFSGSGLSEGETISLGHQQAKDLNHMINEMQKKGNQQFILWGRSMGASTILFYLHEYSRNNIIGCVLDSPYASLWKLSVEIGVNITNLPNFIVTGVLSLIRNKIKDEYGFDMKSMNPLDFIKDIKNPPLLFITSLKDEFVSSEHVVQLYKAFEGIKRLQYIDSSHNSSRPQQIIKIAIDYLSDLQRKRKLRVQKKLQTKISRVLNTQTREIKKLNSFKILRDNPYLNMKENYDINHTEQHDDIDRIQTKLKQQQRTRISQLRQSKLLI